MGVLRNSSILALVIFITESKKICGVHNTNGVRNYSKNVINDFGAIQMIFKLEDGVSSRHKGACAWAEQPNLLQPPE